MLPPELVDEISSYLDFSDLVSFCQADEGFFSEAAMRKVLLRECPCFDIEYSQWNEWRSSAIGYSTVGVGRFEPTLECPVYIDQPLPSFDFHCLCKGINLNSPFSYNDKGMFLDDKFVDLTESEQIPTSCIPPKQAHRSRFRDAVTYDKQMMRVRGTISCVEYTPQFMAVVFSNNDGQLIINVKDVSNEKSPVFGCHFPGRFYFKLQVIGKKAIVAFLSSEHQHKYRYEYSSIIAQDKPTVNVERRYPLLKPPAGLLFYNGHVFDVTMDTRWKPVIQSSMATEPPPMEWSQSKYHTVQQDSRYLHYGQIYNGDGLVVALVDLRTHQVKELTDTSDVPRDDSFPIDLNCSIVGVHNDSVGVWQYTKTYLQERFRRQHGEELSENIMSFL